MSKLLRRMLPVAFVAAAALHVGQANALVLTLDDTMGNTVTVVDNGPGDMVPAAGIVTYTGSLGTWIQNVSTGVSDQILDQVEMDLNSVNVSGGPGTIILTLEDENFNSKNLGGLTSFIAAIGGTTNGTVSTATFIDDSNTVGVLGTQMSASGPFIGGLGGEFSDSSMINDMAFTGPFGLAIQVTITHTEANQITSLNHNLVEVAEPATLGLVGLGLVGVGLMSRRRRQG
jgi:hypothetical protein